MSLLVFWEIVDEHSGNCKQQFVSIHNFKKVSKPNFSSACRERCPFSAAIDNIKAHEKIMILS